MTDAQQSVAEYYARRASEYELAYEKPERQADIRRLEALLSTAFAGEDVLEVACGTGYWTQFIAKSARSITATDCNPEVLDIARRKDYGACRVTFAESDAYVLSGVECECNAGFHGFWWSHVPVQLVASFLRAFHASLQPQAHVIMVDNSYVEGSSTPISRRDAQGDTYQMRTLLDGSVYEVVKNFPSPAELCRALEPFADAVVVEQFDYYWVAHYKARRGGYRLIHTLR